MTVGKKAAGRVGRKPVIAVRVPQPLHRQIVKSSKMTGRSMSEEMAVLLERGLEWTRVLRGRRAFEVGPMKIGIAKLELNAGDTLVLRTDQMLSAVQAKELGDRARALVPEGVKIMLLTAGMSLDVMKKAS